MIGRILMFITGIVLFAPGLCFGFFGLVGMGGNGTAGLGLVGLLIAAILLWSGVKLVSASSR
jgi:hypothetical protein